MLSACSVSGQDTTSSTDAKQTASTSAETSIPESPVDPNGDTTTEVPATYAELLDTYVAALNEKWDGSALMKQRLNLIALGLYDGAPLDNIGYAVLDIDGNGTDELVIGTTANVTNGFYGKAIFDLCTLGQWADDTEMPSEGEKGNASAELIKLLDEIHQDVTTSTTGSYMATTPIAVKLLNWGVGTKMSTNEISVAVIDWMAPKGNDEMQNELYRMK